MSKEIDEKVVSMKFDNKHFMDNTAETMTRLDKLKAKLHFPGAAKGLEEINNAAGNSKIGLLGSAAEQVGLKFNALQVMATTALMNITNSAVNAGKRIAAALTIEPIKMGFSEYETQINAVQTILANTESKGTTLEDVNGALDKLNTYADKTIYNFTEMTRNIGTFTAAGVDLDTSVNAIQGIANLAAVSGSTSQQASTAMYQLSQALSSGTVKLQDWNSVVNAGMGGQVFQDALKETARIHGVAIDDMIEENGSFRETLQEGWLTSEILTETLQKFTMATEGLTDAEIEKNRAMLKSKGYTDEQIDGIFKLGNTATNAATKVKTFSQLMDTLKESLQSGWTQTWEILIGDFEEAKELWTSVSDVFGKLIGDAAEARNSMLQGWADGGGREDMLESFKNIFNAIVSIVKPIKEAFREIFPRTTAEQLIKITEAIREFTSKLVLNEKAQEKLKSAFKGLFAVIDIGVTAIKEIAKGAITLISNFTGLVKGILGVSGSFGDWISGIRDTVKETNLFSTIIGGTIKILQKFIDAIKSVISALKEKFVAPGFEGFLKVITGIWNVIKFVAERIVQVVGTLGKGLLNAFRGGDFKAAMDVFNGGIIATILLNFKKFVGNFTETFSNFSASLGKISDLAGKVGGILDQVKGCFEAYQKDLEAKTLIKIATAIAILAAAILVIASIDPSRLTASLGAVTVLFGELMASMKLFTMTCSNGTGFVQSILAMGVMASAVLTLASALKTISDIKPANMVTGIIGLAALAGIVIATAKLMAMEETTVIKGAYGLVAFSVAMRILASACTALSGMNWGELAKGVVGLSSCLSVLLAAFVVMSKMGGASGAGQMVAMSIALMALVVPIKVLGSMNLAGIAKGVGALVVVIAALVGASALMNGLSIGAGAMVLLSAAMLIFAVALTTLTPALAAISLIDMGAVCGGLLKLAGTLVALGVASLIAPLLVLMGWGLKSLAVGLLAITPVLAAFTLINFGAVFGALMKLAGVLTVVGIASIIAAPLIALLGWGLNLLGTGALLAGKGLVPLAAGIVAFSASLAAGAASIVAAITVIITGIIGLIPAIIGAIGEGVILICNTIAGAATSIGAAISAVIIALCDAIIISLPKLVECVSKLLDALLKFIISYSPKIVSAGMKIIVALLDGIAQKIDDVVAKAVELINAFLRGIGQETPKLIAGAFEMILDFINGIADAIETYTPQLMEACVNLGMSIVKGVVKGLVSIPGAIWEGVKDVGQAIKDGFCDFFGINSPAKEMMPIGQYIDEGIVVGLEKYKGSVVSASEDVGNAAVTSMSNAISGITDAVNSEIDSQPVISPVLDLSNIEAGADSISSIFGMSPSVDVLSNVGSINSMMNGHKNGDNVDILSAIKELGDKISSMSGNTYYINGITYDDGSNVADAVESIVRAARIERRI